MKSDTLPHISEEIDLNKSLKCCVYHTSVRRLRFLTFSRDVNCKKPVAWTAAIPCCNRQWFVCVFHRFQHAYNVCEYCGEKWTHEQMDWRPV